MAIGSSAGGLNQIITFFDSAPLRGVSYVVIQHLSSDYNSILGSLLSKHTKLSVEEARHNTMVETNKIYILPGHNVMNIKDGRLMLTEKHKGVNFTIDTFLHPLPRKEAINRLVLFCRAQALTAQKG